MNRNGPAKSIRASALWSLAATAVAVAVLLIAMGSVLPHILAAAQLRPHAPNWGLWAELPLAVQVHVVAALVALVIGAAILTLPKGVGSHKTLGWTWVAAMGTTAISSLLITGLNGNFYSLIHILSGWVIVGLPMAIVAIRRRKVASHRRAMTGMFIGGLIVAGALTFLPGRFMFHFLLG